MYWLSDYSYRKKIIIDYTKVSVSLTYFPVYILLDSSNFDFSKIRSDGHDIRFTNSNGLSILNYERLNFNYSSQTAEFIVQIPYVASSYNTYFYIYFGNSEASDGNNIKDTWSYVYALALHMNDDTNSTVLDSSLYSNNGTKYMSNQPIQVSGVIGAAQNFDGVDDFIDCGSSSSLDDIVTKRISFWVKLDSQSGIGPTDGSHFINKGTWFIATDPANNRNIFGHDFSTTDGRWSFPQLSLNVWHHIVLHYDRSLTTNDPTIFVDGVSQTVTEYSTPVGTASTDASYNLLISKDSSLSRWVDGVIDEVYILTTIGHSGWPAAIYNSLNNTLVSYSSEEIFDVDVVESPIVKSVEFIEYTLTSTSVSGSVQLTKGQNYNNCVPFMSLYGAADYMDNHMTDLWFTGTTLSGNLNFQRAAHRSSDLYIKTYVVEFDPSEVRVQQGGFGDNLSAGTTDYTTASGFVQNRTGITQYWSSSASTQLWRDHLVKGQALPNGTQVSFYLNNSAGTIKGHYYLFEALKDQFEVEHVDSSYTTGTSIYTTSLSKSYDMLKTFCISSYTCSDATVGLHNNQLVYAFVYHDGQLRFGRSGTTGTIYFNAQVIHFLDNKIHSMCPQYRLNTSSTTLTTFSWEAIGLGRIPADLNYSMVVLSSMYGCYTDSIATGDIDSAFHAIKFTSPIEVSIQRSTSSASVWTHQFYPVDWLGFTVNTGSNLAPLDPTKTFVKSVENIRLSSAYILNIAPLTKGQDVSNCVVFATNYNSGATEAQNQHMCDVFLSSTGVLCKKNFANVANSIADVSVVEFYPDQVRVQSGRKYWPAGTTTLTITPDVSIQTDRTFLLAKWATDYLGTNWSEHLIRIRIVSSTSLEFYKVGTAADMSISWFVAEDLGNNFRTFQTSATTVGGTGVFYENETFPIRNSFSLLSYATDVASTNIAYVGSRLYQVSDFYFAYIDFNTSSGNKYFNVNVVLFINDLNVFRVREVGFDYSVSDASKIATLPTMFSFQNHPNSITAFNNNIASIGRCDATTTNPIDNAFSSYQITDYSPVTVTSTRQAGGYTNWSRVVVICWEGADDRTDSNIGMNYSTKTKSLVQSIENITFTCKTWYEERYLTKGQNVKQCVPFCSWNISQTSNYIGFCFNTVYFGNMSKYPAKLVNYSGNWTNTTKTIQCYIVEFNSDQIKVQHGTVSMAWASTTKTVTIEEVNLNKAFLLFYVCINDNLATTWNYFTICGKFTNSTTLTFYRSVASSGVVSISYFVVECLQDQWEVQHLQSSPGTSDSSYTINHNYSYGYDKTIALISWTSSQASVYNSYSTLRAYDNPMVQAFYFDKGSSTGSIAQLNAELIHFIDEDIRCNGEFFYFDLTTSYEGRRSLYIPPSQNYFDLNRSIVMPTNNIQRNDSSTAEDIDNVFVRYQFANDHIVQGIRQQDTSTTYGSFYAVEFPPYKTHYIDGYVTEEGNPAIRTVRAYRVDTGKEMDETVSVSGTGYFYLETTYSGSHYVVCLDDDGGVNYNDLVYGKIYPTVISGTFLYNEGYFSTKNITDYRGYIMGGYSPGSSNIIESFIFDTETIQRITTVLGFTKYGVTSINSSTNGYVVGGCYDGSSVVNIATIESFIFNTEICSVIIAALDVAKRFSTGINSSTKGYNVGGLNASTVPVAVIEDLIFAVETSNVISATLNTAKHGSAGVSGPLKGYCMGGYTTTYVAVIEDMNFTNDTSNVISATLDTIKYVGTGVNSSTKGYCIGGTNAGGDIVVIEDITFATETSVVISATLDTAKRGATGINSITKGYAFGGTIGALYNAVVVEDLIFSTETSVVISATIELGRSYSAGVQSGSL